MVIGRWWWLRPRLWVHAAWICAPPPTVTQWAAVGKILYFPELIIIWTNIGLSTALTHWEINHSGPSSRQNVLHWALKELGNPPQNACLRHYYIFLLPFFLFLFLKTIFKFYMHQCFACMFACTPCVLCWMMSERVTAGNHLRGAGNWTWAPWKSSKYS